MPPTPVQRPTTARSMANACSYGQADDTTLSPSGASLGRLFSSSDPVHQRSFTSSKFLCASMLSFDRRRVGLIKKLDDWGSNT